MITLKEWMEVVDYRITEGSNYMWQCYGDNAYSLDSWDSDYDGHSFSVIFDTKTQAVYEVQAHDFKNQRAYRIINPDYAKKHKKEAKHRSVNKNEAWETVDYVDLETDDDWFQKALAIASGEDYDTRVSIPIDLPESELMVIFKMAHEADMTFNDYVEMILRERLADEEFTQKLKREVNELNVGH